MKFTIDKVDEIYNDIETQLRKYNTVVNVIKHTNPGKYFPDEYVANKKLYNYILNKCAKGYLEHKSPIVVCGEIIDYMTNKYPSNSYEAPTFGMYEMYLNTIQPHRIEKLKTLINEQIRNIIFSNNNSLMENMNNANYSKFPLNALIKQAKKFADFKEFSSFYSIDIYHGYYWHLTDNPEFKISNTTGPRDMSSMSRGGVSENGAIMLTSDLAYWDEHYNTSSSSSKRDIKRNYVVLFDASSINPKFLKQVGRGFGNEIYLDKNTASKLKHIGVYNLKYAKQLERKFDNTIPNTEEELKELWSHAHHMK